MHDKLRYNYLVQKEVIRSSYFEGELESEDMSRLSELTIPSGQKIGVTFEFVQSEYDVPKIQGSLKCKLDMQCQRCLQAMEIAIDQDFQLLIDAKDDLVSESKLDSVMSDEGYVDIREIIEDELILTIPLVAMHEDTTCHEFWQHTEPEIEPAQKENPFAVLAQLKTKH
ncbi:MAG: hypothetical protein ACI845_001567 [Gammaproteobacteria bacterium]|jgi:uncharacterized protein